MDDSASEKAPKVQNILTCIVDTRERNMYDYGMHSPAMRRVI